jgi:hypothetical protein
VVWIPANLGAGTEQENRISELVHVRDILADDGNYSEYLVEPDGPKYNKIHFAAVMACMPICPSHNVGVPRNHPGNAAAPVLLKAYYAYAPGEKRNRTIPRRIRNKLAYALENTAVEIRIRHKDEEPELIRHNRPPYREEFTLNEIGWQDQLLVTVRHRFALLPGPGRLLARRTFSSSPPARTHTQSYNRQAYTTVRRELFVYPLVATVRLNNEGEKPVLPYIQRVFRGVPGLEPQYSDSDVTPDSGAALDGDAAPDGDRGNDAQ